MSPPFDLRGLISPYDDLYKKQSLLQESLQGQKNDLIAQRQQLPTEYAPSIGGALVSSLAPLVGAFAGGAIGGNVSAPGVMEIGSKYSLAGGQAYFNNLEAHRKQKEDLLSEQMKTLDTQIMYGQRDLAGIESDKLKAQASLGIDYASGKFPGTDPYNIDAASKLNQALAVTNARQSAGGEKIPFSLIQTTYQDQPELLDALKDAVDPNGSISKKTLDFVLRKAGIDDKIRNTNIREQGAAGELKRRPSPAELKDITQLETFSDELRTVKSMLPQMDSDKISRMTKAELDPNSPEYKFYTLLESAQAAFAMSRNKGSLSEMDMNRWDKLFKGNKLLDDKTSLSDRLDLINQLNTTLRKNTFQNMKKGGVNVSPWEDETTSGSSVDFSKAPPNMTIDQFREWKRRNS